MTALARGDGATAALTGTGALARLAVRRDRIALPASVYVITALVAGTAYTFKKLYPTAAGRAALAATGGGNAALRFLYGQVFGSSLGSLTTWRYGIWAAIFASLMTILVVVRHTRTDEEAGRWELVGSTVVGRPRPSPASRSPCCWPWCSRSSGCRSPARSRSRWPSAAAPSPSPGSPPWRPS
jgi:hypothetical protein